MTHLELTGRRATGSGNTSGRLSPVNLLFIGVSPLIGRAILIYLFVKSLIEWSDPANSYSGESWLGWAPPAIIGVGFLLLGVVLFFAWRKHQREHFFKRRREVADPALLE